MIGLLCQSAKHCISLCSDKESISASVYRLVNFYDVIIDVRRLKHVGIAVMPTLRYGNSHAILQPVGPTI